MPAVCVYVRNVDWNTNVQLHCFTGELLKKLLLPMLPLNFSNVMHRTPSRNPFLAKRYYVTFSYCAIGIEIPSVVCVSACL